ncbi:hypothetical protein SO3561_10253 [Streptomyces olivochromogenes]|uniref:Uncharacterized protein n=1 Tax=Streptomyces olivochromogenes TaxID=1963 RepID=A0A286PGJ9_STROL|nr:hypothetical protein SO3561_10253 [Streptomyces olivochromogenes]
MRSGGPTLVRRRRVPRRQFGPCFSVPPAARSFVVSLNDRGPAGHRCPELVASHPKSGWWSSPCVRLPPGTVLAGNRAAGAAGRQVSNGRSRHLYERPDGRACRHALDGRACRHAGVPRLGLRFVRQVVVLARPRGTGLHACGGREPSARVPVERGVGSLGRRGPREGVAEHSRVQNRPRRTLGPGTAPSHGHCRPAACRRTDGGASACSWVTPRRRARTDRRSPSRPTGASSDSVRRPREQCDWCRLLEG